MPTLRRPSSSKSSDLIPVKALIRDSWQAFTRDWKETFLVSRWLILPAVLVLLSDVLDRLFPGPWNWIWATIALLAALITDGWVNVHLIQTTLAREGETGARSSSPWTTQVLGYFWLKLLAGVALIGALLPVILGAMGLPIFISLTRLPQHLASALLFVGLGILSLPAIWLAVNLLFAPFYLFARADAIEDLFGKRAGGLRWPSAQKAIHLLSSSYELVRGRWWQTSVRLVIPGLLFGLLLVASISFADALIQFIAGPEKIEALFGRGVTSVDVNSGSNAYAFFLQALAQSIFLPLFTVWQIKLFCSLKRNSSSS